MEEREHDASARVRTEQGQQGSPRARTALGEKQQVNRNSTETSSFAGCRINGESCRPMMLMARGLITSALPILVPLGFLAPVWVSLRNSPVGDGSVPFYMRCLKHSPHSALIDHLSYI